MKNPPIKFYRSDIWISELVSRIAIIGYGLLLIAAIGSILYSTAALILLDRSIREAKEENHNLERNLAYVEKKVKIYEGIKHVRGKRYNAELMATLTDIVARNSEKFGYDPLLLLAVINVESSFEQNALGRFKDGSYSGAFGLMQLKFETAQLMAERLNIKLKSTNDLFQPEINVPLGIYYLTSMVMRFNSLPLGILAYNLGPGTLEKGLRGETALSRKYYYRVMKSYYRLKGAVSALGFT